MNPSQADNVSSDEVIAELIRLRESDRLDALNVERELRSEIQALWLRVNSRQTLTNRIVGFFHRAKAAR